jgi:hypothetical protein
MEISSATRACRHRARRPSLPSRYAHSHERRESLQVEDNLPQMLRAVSASVSKAPVHA